MTAEDVIRQVQEYHSEWLEMCSQPTDYMVGALAQKIVHLQEYIDHLERRLQHDSSQTVRIN